jgi:hypothetical protein
MSLKYQLIFCAFDIEVFKYACRYCQLIIDVHIRNLLQTSENRMYNYNPRLENLEQNLFPIAIKTAYGIAISCVLRPKPVNVKLIFSIQVFMIYFIIIPFAT